METTAAEIRLLVAVYSAGMSVIKEPGGPKSVTSSEYFELRKRGQGLFPHEKDVG
jgi:hypothetical protein